MPDWKTTRVRVTVELDVPSENAVQDTEQRVPESLTYAVEERGWRVMALAVSIVDGRKAA